MTEWQIIESDNFSHLPPDEPEPGSGSSWRRWLLLAAGIGLFLVVIGLLTLRTKREERRTAIQDDLAEVIFEEETQQFLGNVERVTDLMVLRAPGAWQAAYQQLFTGDTPRPPPGSAQIQTIDFDGQCAVVMLTLYGSEQLRVYCLEEGQWRRAPASSAVWGRGQESINLTEGVRLYFRPRDKAFAKRLAVDLRQFLKELKKWAFRPGAVAHPSIEAELSLEIIIEPQDLRSPLIAEESQRIVLNSPQAVSLDGVLSGPDKVRLALAQVLLGRLGPFVDITETSLPGTTHFLQAAQTVVAMRLILPADTQTALRDSWRARLDGQWVSPFFASLLDVDPPLSAEQIDLAARLLVDYIYQDVGYTTVGLIIHQIPLMDSWDSLFKSTLGRRTTTLEEEAAGYAQATPTSARQTDHTLPLTAMLLRVENRAGSGNRAHVESVDHNESLLVELPTSVAFRARDETFLPTSCVPSGTRLTIEGQWLEVGWRLRASEITVQEVAPPSIEPAPPDTVAYLLDNPRTEAPTLTALRDDGTLHPLITLGDTLKLLSLPVTGQEQPHFLFIFDTPECGRSWFIHYRPDQGVTGQWLAPLPPMQWVWRADQQDLWFFSRRGDDLGYDVYETGKSLSLKLVGQSREALAFIGWNVAAQRLVATNSWFGEVYVGLFDLETGTILPMVRPRFQPLRFRRLSHDGNWLAYLAGVQNLFGPPDRLDVVNMLDDTERTLIRVETREGLRPPVWSLYLAHNRLVVISGPVTADEVLLPVRLLLASPDQPDHYRIVAQAAAGERLSTPVFCADGSLLYRASQQGTYHLRRQTPGLRARTLLTLERSFIPLACF